MLNRINDAAELFLYIIKERRDDTRSLMNLAECFYRIKDYDNLRKILSRIALYALKLENEDKLIVYQWIM